ncbi:hypothetical protein, partial [Nocardia abscessus]|uniref:hypothetical protein n=1 Tax=Nocardia abscessus TaxID=120957 RepID=UPI00245830A6
MTDAAAHGVSAPSPAAGRDRFRATDRRGAPPRAGEGGGGRWEAPRGDAQDAGVETLDARVQGGRAYAV